MSDENCEQVQNSDEKATSKKVVQQKDSKRLSVVISPPCARDDENPGKQKRKISIQISANPLLSANYGIGDSKREKKISLQFMFANQQFDDRILIDQTGAPTASTSM